MSDQINVNVSATNAYPFMTKAACKTKLLEDPEFAAWAITTLYKLQTAYEQSSRATAVRNKAGFMSSHAWHGCRIAQMLISGLKLEELEAEDVKRVRDYAPCYSKQISRVLRVREISQNPALAKMAGIFSSCPREGDEELIARVFGDEE